MSFKSQCTITCDGCGVTLNGGYISRNLRREQADQNGWLTAYIYKGTTKDYCKSCTEEYARLYLNWVEDENDRGETKSVHS